MATEFFFWLDFQGLCFRAHWHALAVEWFPCLLVVLGGVIRVYSATSG